MQRKWYRLDTAALIFPAVARRDWSNAFRVSATLKDEIDPALLQCAADDLKRRFPSFFVTLHRGLFWYYLEEGESAVKVRSDYAYPLALMTGRELKRSCIRILYYKNRIAVECFHSVTDGRGGSVFLCNLAARYIELRYGVTVPREGLIKDLSEKPSAGELEDSFLKNSAEVGSSRREARSYRLRGTRELSGFKTLTTGIADTAALVEAAHRFDVSVTALLAAVMAECVIAMQDLTTPKKRQRAVKITVPVDLRRLYGSETLRNFSLVLNVGVDPRIGDYSLGALCSAVYHQLRAYATPQHMAGMIAANVLPQKVTAIRLAPVFIKNIVMDGIYRSSGECGGSLNVSNLTEIVLPEVMRGYVERMEFIIGPQRSYPNNCSVLSFGGKTYINMIRNIKESELERRFFSRLVELGIPVEIECNRRDR